LGELCHRPQLYDLEDESMNACETASGMGSCLRLGRKDGLFTVEARLFLPRPLEIVFPFFADAGNLEILTPPWLRFEIVTPRPIVMRSGAFIDYRLRLHGVHLRWQSEITAWEPPHRFVDEQRRGPYRVWIHEHTFTESKGGCEVRDFVRYAAPGGWLVDRLFVRHDVRRIFEYRTRKLQELFV
jgi:ligand-binding SRPBCC domain-containing protein